MSDLLAKAKENRLFVDKTLTINSWDDVKCYFEDLFSREISTLSELEQWMKDRSELDAVLEEDLAWRYIKMNCDTSNQLFADHFNYFVGSIEPEVNKYSNLLDQKFTSCPCFEQLDKNTYFTLVRSTRNKMDLFREANLSLNAEIQQESQEYGVVCSKQTIVHEGTEYTLQQAAIFLKENNRQLREDIYRNIHDRRMLDTETLHDLLTRLVTKRHQVAKNAGFETYSTYRFKELGRFDYTREHCEEFHQSVKQHVLPLVSKINNTRKNKLGFKELRPWDSDVDVDGLPPLKPFSSANDLLDKTTSCFEDIDPDFAHFITIMRENNHFDLDSRKGKAPGGFNYPLYESNAPFIYMNSAGTLRDLETMVHEGGHAIHSFLSSHLDLVDFKSLPSEVAELASMSMELISMEHWGHFFPDSNDLRRAKRSQLEGVISILPWVMIVDSFQDYLYHNINDSVEEKTRVWTTILDEFSDKTICWQGLEHYRNSSWQKQLHIFEVPFYYIEYAISQLGAISIWKNYKEQPKKTIEQYKHALSLGYTASIPQIYEAAGIRFDFSSDYIAQLMAFVASELDSLNA